MHLLYKPQTPILRTLSALIHFPNSTVVFGHRATLIYGNRDMAGGFLLEQLKSVDSSKLCSFSCQGNSSPRIFKHVDFYLHVLLDHPPPQTQSISLQIIPIEPGRRFRYANVNALSIISKYAGGNLTVG